MDSLLVKHINQIINVAKINKSQNPEPQCVYYNYRDETEELRDVALDMECVYTPEDLTGYNFCTHDDSIKEPEYVFEKTKIRNGYNTGPEPFGKKLSIPIRTFINNTPSENELIILNGMGGLKL